MISISVFFLSALISLISFRFLIPFFIRFLPDPPNNRSSHTKTIPRGGGLVFVCIGIVASFLGVLITHCHNYWPFPVITIPLLAAPVSVISFIDDRFTISALPRFAFQILSAGLVVCSSSLILSSPFLFFSFMDGLDGLVASCMLVSITTIAFQLTLPWPFWALVGALLGFLPWNWSPAKLFMGDVGSTFLGTVFSALVLQANSLPELLSFLLLSSPLLCDSCICLIRRFLAGHNVFRAHRLHLFQRLHQAGWSHARVSSLYVFGTVVLSISLHFGNLFWVLAVAVLELFIGILLDQYSSVPFAASSRT